jgi:hypothetical protein
MLLVYTPEFILQKLTCPVTEFIPCEWKTVKLLTLQKFSDETRDKATVLLIFSLILSHLNSFGCNFVAVKYIAGSVLHLILIKWLL